MKYKGRDTKIGTCESLYYVSYPKFMEALSNQSIQRAEHNLPPREYAKFGSGFLFRFPFPDEDRLKFGFVELFNRAVPIVITDPGLLEEPGHHQNQPYRKEIGLEFQKPVQRISDGKECLAIVCREGQEPFSELFRLEDDADVLDVVRNLAKNNIAVETDPGRKSFYQQIAQRIVEGYGLKLPIEIDLAMNGKLGQVAQKERKRTSLKGIAR